VPRKREDRVRQEAAAGRDAYIAGRDQFIFNVGVPGREEPVVPGLLPRDVPAFTGREGELGRLDGLAVSGAVVVTAVVGTAGIGKTALAVHAAHRLAPQFPDGQLYADLHGYTAGQSPAELGEVLEVFLRRLGVPAEEIPASVEERSGSLRQLLALRRVLILLDNAATEGQVRPLLPGSGESLVLVTSRSVLTGLEVNERISLDVLSEDEAIGLLAGLIGKERAAAEPEAAAQVAEWCGRLPLALRIAGQLLAAHPSWPVAKLASMLADERDRLQRLAAGDLQVRAAFEISYRQLADGDARMFRLLGLHPGPDFDARAAAALAEIEDEAAEPVLDRLVLASLLTEDGSGRFGMHDLLRLFARATCQEADDQAARDAAEARLIGWYADLAGVLDACVDPQQRPAAAQEAEQARVPLPSIREALAMFAFERTSLVAAVGLAAQRSWDEQVWRLARSMDGSLRLLHYLDDLLTVWEAALAAARRADDIPFKGWALGNLGNAYQELRRFEEAIACYQESLAISRETGDRHREGTALGNLGNAYWELRRFEEAIGCYQQSLAIRRETGDRRAEGPALGNLGNAYSELRRFEEAIGCFQESLAIYHETGDRRAEGRTLSDLGTTYGELRRFEEAIGCFQESLAICRETGDRYCEGTALNNLGLAYGELRRFEEAIGCYQESLVIRRETSDRHGEGLILDNLGNAYQKLRRPDRAAACWRDAAAAMRDAGDYEQAARLEELAANSRSRRRRWRRTG
jgi:tetratricopeptide (TPR) repeat protein